jgi:uncharacterized membrane protein YeaQ/YmgE (transglycosylase-associated protein family)
MLASFSPGMLIFGLIFGVLCALTVLIISPVQHRDGTVAAIPVGLVGAVVGAIVMQSTGSAGIWVCLGLWLFWTLVSLRLASL